MSNLNKAIDNIDEVFLTAKNGEIYTTVIGHIEKEVIEKALAYSSGNKISAAKMLGINRNTIHAKIKKHNIDIERFKR